MSMMIESANSACVARGISKQSLHHRRDDDLLLIYARLAHVGQQIVQASCPIKWLKSNSVSN